MKGVKNPTLMKQGLELAKKRLAEIGFTIDFDYQETTRDFSSVTFNNPDIGIGVSVDPLQILDEVKGRPYRVACLIFDWDLMKPRPSNPVHHGYLINGCTPIQLPEQWYGGYPEVLCQFFLHEYCGHACTYLSNILGNSGLPDITHAMIGNMQPTDYYLSLMLRLKQYWPLFDFSSTKPVVTLTRTKDTGKETLGTLTATINGTSFTCNTLELPWKNNARNISCVPKGVYECKWTFWPNKLKSTYELQLVPGRGGIKIHVGNYFSDIQGCILLGNGLSDINKDGQLDVINSKITIAAFEKLLNKQPFTLQIK